ncbi:class I SAM-dependent methyltransferase [Actinacidiphila paucisporea]|uniref:Ubiquinone/menaquinone biosynthesis C-methylase UbiE n=1 Tax=Actinacidiphila paucisporea TaxID=310782 RepID=A0A1M7PW70_9ACTN|nr:class I SAM-dependent methyltransferase [Actinacidiphila paucisporea]SHN21870.1 Ubiquinone/menaquinone biosynthesis C-methylase UbiE [Actinacidiphila paucisporea]
MPLLRDAELSSAFDHGSRAYDRLVAANPGYHAHLRRSARRLRLRAGGAGLRLLDLGCGTGASTAALLAAAPHAEIVAVDASAGMLERAAAKRWPPSVSFVHAPVEDLAATAATSGRFDAAFAAYLFRNVADPDGTLATVRDLLVPGGRLAVHEYALAGGAAERAVWAMVCKGIVLPAGRLVGDAALYRHLYDSVVGFDTPAVFGRRMRQAGFTDVRVLPLPGWQTGITHTFVGRSPGAAGEAFAAGAADAADAAGDAFAADGPADDTAGAGR